MNADPDEDASGPDSTSNPLGFEATDRAAIASALQADDAGWVTQVDPLDFAGVRWRPDLEHRSGALCHVHLEARLRSAWVARITAARVADRRVSVAGPEGAFRSEDTLVTLDGLGVSPVILRQSAAGAWRVEKFRSTALLIAKQGLLLRKDARVRIGHAILERAEQATIEKGSLFEEFLCLLFSQIAYFDLYQTNKRNRTQEMDLVFLNRKTGTLAIPSAPLVLVSAKNTGDPADAAALRSLHAKIDSRRGMCRLGFLCSAGRMANTVAEEDLRYSKEEKVIVLLDGKDLRNLLESDDLDEAIEKRVIDAAFR